MVETRTDNYFEMPNILGYGVFFLKYIFMSKKSENQTSKLLTKKIS